MSKARNYTAAVVGMTTSFAAITAARRDRSALIVSNQDASIAIKIAFDAAGTKFFTLAAGATFEFEVPPIGIIYAASASGTPNLLVAEA